MSQDGQRIGNSNVPFWAPEVIDDREFKATLWIPIGFFEFTFMKHRADLPLERLAITHARVPGGKPSQGILRRQNPADDVTKQKLVGSVCSGR